MWRLLEPGEFARSGDMFYNQQGVWLQVHGDYGDSPINDGDRPIRRKIEGVVELGTTPNSAMRKLLCDIKEYWWGADDSPELSDVNLTKRIDAVVEACQPANNTGSLQFCYSCAKLMECTCACNVPLMCPAWAYNPAKQQGSS